MADAVVVGENRLGRYQQEITVGQHVLIADEPISVGGTDAGPAPFDFLMASLGACTSMTLRMYAERKGLALDRVSVALSHEKIEFEGKPRDRINRTITLEGDLSDEQRQRLLEIANKCPLHRALSQPLLLSSTLAEEALTPDFAGL